MKTNMKLMLLLAGMLPLAIACNNSSADHDHTDSASATHTHTYSCPMHPEVTGKEGDTCPKCGMKLEHTDNAAPAKGDYYMEFGATPTTIEPNKDAVLSFIPKKKNATTEQVALEIEHEKKIHLILVSDDLSWFDHIHPEYTANGSYIVPAKFPAPGKYIAFADYKPSGAGHVVDKIDINVAGTPPAAKAFSGNTLSGNSGNYSFELKPTGGKLITGALLHISGVVKKDGKAIDANLLDNYLGAKAHFVMISMNEKEYLHIHPTVANGEFDLHTTFEKPGVYRGWVQFNADGKLHTIDFTMTVTEGSAEDIKNANQSHTDKHTGGGDHKH